MNKLNYDYEGPLLKNFGRFYLDTVKKAKMFTFSCSGFEVRFRGTRLEAELIASECGRPQGEGAVEILIDDMRFEQGHKIALDQPQATYVLAENLPQGEHRIRLYKRTESSCSLTGWLSLRVDGEFLPVHEKRRLKIEIYGDSIAAGNGDEGVVGDDEFVTRTENALLSFEALTAERLDADFSVVAIGGFAAYKSPWNTDCPIKNIPAMFSFANFTWGTDEQSAIPWDNKRFVPDITIIALGTNDDEYLLPLKEPLRHSECIAFQKAIKDFIAVIQKAYPKTKIIVCIGMIQVSLVTALLKEVVDSYPQNVYFLPFDTLKVGGFMASGGHPNRAMHQAASDELYALIKKII